MGRLDGKVALISGGARGQGATEAKLFAREGAKVVLGDIRDAEGKQVEAEIRAAGGEATYMHLDVTSDAEVQRWRTACQVDRRDAKLSQGIRGWSGGCDSGNETSLQQAAGRFHFFREEPCAFTLLVAGYTT